MLSKEEKDVTIQSLELLIKALKTSDIDSCSFKVCTETEDIPTFHNHLHYGKMPTGWMNFNFNVRYHKKGK